MSDTQHEQAARAMFDATDDETTRFTVLSHTWDALLQKRIAEGLDAAFERGKAEGARIENEACAQICNRVSDGWEENAMVCRNLILARQQPSGGAK